MSDLRKALEQLRALAGELDRSHPGAAASLREGMEETLTLTRLGVRREMALRRTAAGMLEAERQFRKIIGYRDLATLVIAIERDHDRRRHCDRHSRTPTTEAAIVLTA